jgi:thiamine-monophosphate kinase
VTEKRGTGIRCQATHGRACSSEIDRIDRLGRLFSASAKLEGVVLPIGDDAAVLAPGNEPLVWTVDTAVEGVHFRREWLTLEDIGWRSLMSAASDLAAMGARPRGVLSALVLPSNLTDSELEALTRGQAAAAEALGTAVIGGNLSLGGELSVTTTVLGAAERPLRRDTAQTGDVVALAGNVGLARAGLEALRRGLVQAATEPAIAAWRRPIARIPDGLAAAPHAHAAIDLSDGLAMDAWRVATASRIRIELDENRILEHCGEPLSAAAKAITSNRIDLALRGGEDYALLITLPAGVDLPGFFPVGTCTEGQGLALRDAAGTVTDLSHDGFDHFVRCR